ncbi:MAG: hypothetical protein E7369_03870 [Clostridiales bacterium]|nr:hypothetical protein [Clostridiales bacterium]
MLGFIVEGQIFRFSPTSIYIVLGVVVALVLALYVLRSIGVYKLARNSESNLGKIAFLAWIPFAWIYVAGRLVGKVNFFGKPIKNFALLLVIVFSLTEALNLAYNFIQYFPLVGYYLNGGEVLFTDAVYNETLGHVLYAFDSGIYVGTNIVYPYSNLGLIGNLLFGIGIASDILGIVSIVMLIFFYIALFKKYWPMHFFAAVIWSIWGLFPIFVFVIRNKKATSYEEFMKERYQRMYGGGNPFNPYGQGTYNPYNDNSNPRPPETPYSDFAESGEVDADPFDEFDENNNKDE